MTDDEHKLEKERFLLRRRFARECALQALYQADVSKDWDWSETRNEAFWEQLREAGHWLPEHDMRPARRFAEGIVRGVIEFREKLDARLEQYARNWSVSRMSAVDRTVLRMAAFEMLHRPDTPRVAVIDEAIELVKRFGDHESGRFVNGILDRLLREIRDSTPPP